MGQRLGKLFKRHGYSQPDLRPATIIVPSPLPVYNTLPSLNTDVSSAFKRQKARGPKALGKIEEALEGDTPEAMRLNMQHRSVRFMTCGNYFAPVHDELVSGIKVLDAGCATGIWTIEMAKAYPNSEFIGSDIADGFKAAALIAPSNCRFDFGDTIKGLPYDDNTFDFVFQRFMTGCFTDEGWLMAIKELIRVTKPGGWVELVDNQGWAVNAGPRTQEFFQTLYLMMGKRGVDVKWSSNFRTVLKNQGLEDVIFDYFSVPSGWGPEEIAESSAKNFMAGFLAFKKSMQFTLGLTDSEYEEMVVEAMQELRPFQTFWNADFTYGRKPLVHGNSAREVSELEL